MIHSPLVKLPRAEFGLNHHQEDALHFTTLYVSAMAMVTERSTKLAIQYPQICTLTYINRFQEYSRNYVCYIHAHW